MVLARGGLTACPLSVIREKHTPLIYNTHAPHTLASCPPGDELRRELASEPESLGISKGASSGAAAR